MWDSIICQEKNKDKSLNENLRPISLLKVDYKILTKVIAKRIEKALPKIIGYVKRLLYKPKYQIDSRYNVSQELQFLVNPLTL